MTTVVFVRWVDAHINTGQQHLRNAMDTRPDQMETAGILISEGEDYITVAQDLFGGGAEYDGEKQVRATETIPRVGILEMQRWEIRTGKRKGA